MSEDREQRQGWPARVVIAGIVTSAMVLTAVLLVGINWFGSQQTLLHVANNRAHGAAQITAGRIQRLVAPAEDMLRGLSYDAVVNDTHMPQRLDRLAALASKLRTNPLLSSVYVGYGDGDFIAVRLLDSAWAQKNYHPPKHASIVVQTIERNGNTTPVGVYFFYDSQYRLLTTRVAPTFQIDPRTRPWYRQAIHSDGLAITQPYVFYESGRVGISLSRHAHNARAVVGVDMSLVGLSRLLGQLDLPDHTELALVDGWGRIIGSRRGQPRLAPPDTSAATSHLPTLNQAGAASLRRLWALDSGQNTASYSVDGRQWVGVMLPFHGLEGLHLTLLVAIPSSGLLSGLTRARLIMVAVAIVLLLLFLPLGWWVGRKTGMVLEATASQAHRMSHFDFCKSAAKPTVIREAITLRGVMDDVGDTMEAFLSISHILGTEDDLDTMLDKVLERVVTVMRCTGGAVYLHDIEQHPKQGSETLTWAAGVGDKTFIERWRQHAVTKQEQRDTGLVCKTFGLHGRHNRYVGMLVLQHVDDNGHDSDEFLAFANRLTGMLAVTIETRQLTESREKLFDAMVRVVADAIDAKSPYTGGHCSRVPEIAMMLSDHMEAATSGPYADFQLDGNERRSFQLAAWLHDTGKITSPESIVDKATKLETIYNRINEIRMRFEVLWRDAEITSLQAQLAGVPRAEAAAQRDATQVHLQEDFHFVAQCNMGGEFMQDTELARLRALAATTWQRHFDDRQGLSRAERQRLDANRLTAVELPATEYLLADKAEHLIPWGNSHKPAVQAGDPDNIHGFDMDLPAYRQNLGELHNLSIERGTLSPEDRYLINDHVVQTLVVLKKLPWPEHLARVPELAATHHERMDGQGYPRRLDAGSLSILDRMLALADVFEALTAPDRPYKSAKTVSTSLRIMALMCQEGHLDTQLYLYFLRERIWADYAEQFIAPAQIDKVDIDLLAELATQPPSPHLHL